MIKKQKKSLFKFTPHWIVFYLIILICLIGVFFIYQASSIESFNIYGHQYHFVKQQVFWLVIGFLGMIVAFFIPSQLWYKSAKILYFASLVLLLMVFVPNLGMELNGAKRWILIAGFSFQPIEFIKITLIIFFASWMSKHQRIESFIAMSIIPALILLLQPDMGSLLILLWIVFNMFFISGAEIKTLGKVIVLGLVALFILVVTSSYRMQRLMTYLNPADDPMGAGFHIRQITLALGSGGWFGVGIGNSQQCAFIPEASTDSIFAIIAEEIGFAGAQIIIILYFLLFYFIYKIAIQQKNRSFKQLVVFGILLWISGQVLLNLAAVVSLVPLTGLPLPFISYGGSSLVFLLFGVGILLRIGAEGK